MKHDRTLRKWFENTRGSRVDVIIAGEIFGGRVQESPQLVRELEVEENTFRVRFGSTEVLIVDNPRRIKLGKYGQLIVELADRASFGWHYYGRSQTADNWCERIYELEGKEVHFRETGPLMPGERTFRYDGKKFIELL